MYAWMNGDEQLERVHDDLHATSGRTASDLDRDRVASTQQHHEEREDAEHDVAGVHVGEESDGQRERPQEVRDDLEHEDEAA